MTKKDEPICALNIRKIEYRTRSRFKALCAILQVPMEEAVIKMIEFAIEQGKIPGVPDTIVTGKLPRVS